MKRRSPYNLLDLENIARESGIKLPNKDNTKLPKSAVLQKHLLLLNVILMQPGYCTFFFSSEKSDL